MIDAVGAEEVEVLRVTSEDEYFPLPPSLRSLLSTLQAVVEGGVSARIPGRPGLLEQDRTWGAAEALDLLATPA